MSEILKINDLWGGYQEGVDILRGISLEVQQGEAVGIIGLNGSGKSTFGKAIMNMIPIRRGQISFEGEDITALTTSQLSHRGISIMQQGGRVFQNLSVWDNLQLAMGSSRSSLITHHSSLQEIIPLLQRPKKELQQLMADKLSGGQKHQLALAMALAASPRLVILDEPSAGLSPKSVEEMYTMLHAVRETFGASIVLIEQNIAKAVEFCNRNLMFQLGELLLTEIHITDISTVDRLMFKR